MGDPEDTALSLVGKVYDAALDKHKWPSFLEAFAHAVGGSSAILRSADVQADTAIFVSSVGYDPSWQSAYCNHFVKLDYYIPFMNQHTLGTIFSSEHHFDQAELSKSEFYNDYLLPLDKPHALGVLLSKEGSRSLVLGVQRGKRAGAFGAEEIRLLNILAPHVTRAVQVHRKLSSITVEKEWALGALDQLRIGIILTDSLGVPLFVNRAAEQMMAPGDGVSICHGRLVLSNPAETALLHKLVANAAQGAAIGGDMSITLSNKFDVLQCLVTPVSPELSGRLNTNLGSGCAAIFLSKPGSLQLSPKRLAALYGLSPAESRLVAMLAELNRLEQAANDLVIALSTARAQLASVFAKTGARGQGELLMLLATGTLAYCRDG